MIKLLIKFIAFLILFISQPHSLFYENHKEISWEVPYISQLPNMPNGCEVTSITMLLNFYGYNNTKEDIFNNYMPHNNEYTYTELGYLVGPSPFKFYGGYPTSTTGLGLQCFAPVWVQTINNLLKDNYSNNVAVLIDIKNISNFEEELKKNPLIIGITTDLKNGQIWMEYIDKDTFDNVHIYRNFHCVVLVGYDEEYFFINDPLGIYDKIEKQKLFDAFVSVESQCVAIK